MGVGKRTRHGFVAALLAFGIAWTSAAPAWAQRPATPTERRAIRHLVYDRCVRDGGQNCQRAAVRVSTVDTHFAFGGAVAEGMSGALVRKHRGRWHILTYGGGGLGDCSGWRRYAPEPVVKDLHLYGISNRHPEGGRC